MFGEEGPSPNEQSWVVYEPPSGVPLVPTRPGGQGVAQPGGQARVLSVDGCRDLVAAVESARRAGLGRRRLDGVASSERA